jgi:AMMECR1 domain-containing protein
MELLYQIRKDKELNREEFYRRVMRKAWLWEIQRLMFENEYKEETFDVLITMKEKDTEWEDDSDQEVTIKKKPDENI